jgi:hypothetical protein
MMCKDEIKNERKRWKQKTFTKCKISTTFHKKKIFFFSKILYSKLKGISLDYELLMI